MISLTLAVPCAYSPSLERRVSATGHRYIEFARKRQENTQNNECNITASRHYSTDRQNGSVDRGLSDSGFGRYSGGAGAWQLLVFTLLSGFHASSCRDRTLYCLCARYAWLWGERDVAGGCHTRSAGFLG